VKGDAEFKVNAPDSSLTAYLLPKEPSFLVNFTLGSPHPTVSNVTFTISERDYDCLDVKTSRRPFANAQEAAAWLIDSLSLPIGV
jgi:hypothetical protein